MDVQAAHPRGRLGLGLGHEALGGIDIAVAAVVAQDRENAAVLGGPGV